MNFLACVKNANQNKMNIFGIGSDLVNIKRIQGILRKNRNFKNRVFSKKEIVIGSKKNNQPNYYAKRFAAKEAFSKALGTGISKGLSFKDIEILNNKKGKPILNINGKSKKIVKKLIKKRFKTFVSLSDEKSHAIASVIISIN